MSGPSTPRFRYGLLAPWPVGLALALVNAAVAVVSAPMFAVQAGIYVALAAVAIRGVVTPRQLPAVTLVAAAIVLFAIAGFTGEPTASRPSSMVVNTAVLLVVSIAVLVGAVGLLLQFRRSPRVGVAVPAMVVFGLGTGGFVLNLLARLAIVLTGAEEQQLAVEATHWSAAQYLRGTTGPVDFVGYTLVWLDLVQIAYVVSAYAAAAALAWLAVGESAVPRRIGTVLTAAGCVLAVALSAGAGAAIALPHAADAVPATVAFVTSIPFMATLIPYALGAAILATAAHRSPTTQEWK
ncbi:hypothetical protein IU450_26205 [Nocardia abscessus]|uniref:hypothetical protein n=1 Tax=Nocardia abscessus TaxID=120957 RepID=UPI00189618FE|nr:hypothetical protein [Nocardia abscessus]MBF6339360.1 hypothetical protein [Nocardia abscessus]